MIVTVVDRGAMEKAWGTPKLYTVITRTIEISDYCPICGRERGKPGVRHLIEDGYPYIVHVWANPCGHVDKYLDVIKESENKLNHSRPVECVMYDESDYFPNLTEYIAQKMIEDFRKRLNKEIKFRLWEAASGKSDY